MSGYLKDEEVKLSGNIPKVRLAGTETSAIDISLRENAGSIEFYNESSSSNYMDMTPTEMGYLDTFLTLLGDPNTETLTGDKTLTTSDTRIQFLDPNGSDRNLTMPSESSCTGILYMYFILNNADADERITIKNPSGATLVTLDQDELGILLCDGTNWKGFRAFKG